MVCLLAAVAAATGCGPDNGLNLAPVRGTVSYKGELLKNGTVMFEPDESQGTTGPTAFGVIQSNGTYVLSSESSGDGAVVGTHRVGIVGLDPTPIPTKGNPEPEKAPQDLIKAKAEVAAARPTKGQGATFTDRGGRTYRIVVPLPLGRPDSSGIKVKVDSGWNVFNIAIKEDGSAAISP